MNLSAFWEQMIKRYVVGLISDLIDNELEQVKAYLETKGYTIRAELHATSTSSGVAADPLVFLKDVLKGVVYALKH